MALNRNSTFYLVNGPDDKIEEYDFLVQFGSRYEKCFYNMNDAIENRFSTIERKIRDPDVIKCPLKVLELLGLMARGKSKLQFA